MPGIPKTISSSTDPRPIVFTAQSKRFFYCRDAICEFVFNNGAVPVNPFRVFGYFLGDRVDRGLVREANNNLIRLCDQLWVFGNTIANGVLFEIVYAHELGRSVQFYSVATTAREIHAVSPRSLRFEPELYRLGYSRDDLVEVVTGFRPAPTSEPRLFDPDEAEVPSLEDTA